MTLIPIPSVAGEGTIMAGFAYARTKAWPEEDAWRERPENTRDMREHVRILGILNIVYGCLGALAGVVVLIIFGGVAGAIGTSIDWGRDSSDAAAAIPILGAIALFVAIFLLILSLPSIIGGWGLLNFRPWARVLMIVVSVLNLFHIPIGTALGVYGLWVLLHDHTRRLFETGGQFVPVAAPYSPPPMSPQRPVYPPQTPPGS